MASKLLGTLLLLAALSMLFSAFVAAAASRGVTQAATLQTLALNSCTGQCREIDEVWQRTGPLIRGSDQIWDLSTGSWQPFRAAYPLVSAPPATIPSGMCFPIAQNSFKANTRNFGSPRNNGAKCHAGIDLFTQGDGTIVAIDDGVVTNIHRFMEDCDNGPGDAVLIYHPNVQGGVTINYGEMNRAGIQVSIGQSVRRGQYLGKATACQSGGNTMLHFELYKGRISATQRWDQLPAGMSVTQNNECIANSLLWNVKPAVLLNPGDLLNSVQGNFCQPS